MITGRRPTCAWTWDPATGAWSWDEAMFRLHGYEPGEVRPHTDLVLAHKLDADRAEAERIVRGQEHEPRAFAVVNRIERADGSVVPVAVVGRVVDGVVTGEDVWLDEPATMPGEEPPALGAVPDDIGAVLARRDVIGQAKGMIRAGTHLGEAEAFEVLRHMSQLTNTKVHQVAERLVAHLLATEVVDPARREDLIDRATRFAEQLRVDTPPH